MPIVRISAILAVMIFVIQSYAQPPFEILKSCVDRKAKNSSISVAEFVDGLVAKINQPNCENQFNQIINDRLYGMVTCNDIFYIIINNKKLKASAAINMSINPEIQPGDIFSNRASWYKIDQDNKSYLCIFSSLSEQGAGSSRNQYYIAENAFTDAKKPILYYYFFDKDIMPITSPNL